MSKVSVIGSGFSGLASACFLAAAGHEVTVHEKNATPGGRARAYREDGFFFDMGPSWYWMPDVFEQFFNQFGKSAADYYQLVQLDPGFCIWFGKDDKLDVPASIEALYETFETIEKGSAARLKKFLAEAKHKYDVGMRLVHKPSFSWFEYMNGEVLGGMMRSHVFKSVRSYVRGYFSDPRLVALMEFPVLFLGAMPDRIPALYSLMNYAALSLGTWYPMGGMYRIVEAMKSLAQELGAEIRLNSEVKKIETRNNKVVALHCADGVFGTEGLIAAADYHHVEQKLLRDSERNYNEAYWDKRTFAPSCLIYYVGVKRKLEKLQHHNLFFDTDFEKHAEAIYRDPSWPDNPLFYVCCPSKTDPHVAPEGMENLFLLVPVAPGLDETPETRKRYFDHLIARIEKICGHSFAADIVYQKSYCVSNFIEDYNAYKGNAYGLANTLRQTAVWKPSLRNKKTANLFYAGQLTVPGPGVPPALVSGQLAANQLIHYFSKRYESVI